MTQQAMQLVIAEKHSVAKAIAAALGVTVKKDGYYEGNGLIVINCVGHLVELAAPEHYDERLKNWRREDLPFIPATFDYRINRATCKQFYLIKKLLAREDLVGVINACDAGREGELIFDLVLSQSGSTLSVQRAWIQSLTVGAIREGFRNLRPGAAYSGLCLSAHARQRADWLVGINATRAQTLVARAAGAQNVYSLGRVQTPTLAIVVDRDLAIENFKPVDFYRVSASFHPPQGGKYTGWWFRTGAESEIVDRLETAEQANQIVSRVKQGGEGTVLLVNKKTIKVKALQLFNLAQLQRDANRIHGFTIARTLELAQSLYEKQAITYPRTSSQYLSTDLNVQIGQHLAAFHCTPLGEFAAEIEARNWRLKTHHVDDKKVTDHHAIVPTTQRVDVLSLSADERIIYEMIARRFLAGFYPEAFDERTHIVSVVARENFVTRGTRELEAGWRVVDPPQSAKAKTEASDDTSESDADDPITLPEVVEKSTLTISEVESIKRQTKAPSRLTEGMLLSAMETAGKIVEDPTLREAMKMNGLGTDATRAAILEKLIERQYVFREGRKKFIRSTPVGRELIARLRQSDGGASVLASPEMTGSQEAKLARIERGELTLDDVMSEMKKFTLRAVADIFAQSKNTNLMLPKDSIPCPKCKFAGRQSFLKVCKSKGEKAGEFLGCTSQREVCGYTSAVPKNGTQMEWLTTKSCSVCSSALRLCFGKARGTPFLACTRQGCDEVMWFPKKKRAANSEKENVSEAA